MKKHVIIFHRQYVHAVIFIQLSTKTYLTETAIDIIAFRGGVSLNRDNLILHPKALKGEDGYRVFSVRVKEETLSRLEDLCKETGYNRNELIRTLVEFALDHCEVEK